MRSRVVIVIIMAFLVVLSLIASYWFFFYKSYINCSSRISLRINNAHFVGNYLILQVSPRYGFIRIFGVAFIDGKSVNIDRSFHVRFTEGYGKREVYKLEVIKDSVRSTDKLAHDANNPLKSWAFGNVYNVENISRFIYIEKMSNPDDAYLLSTPESPFMICSET